MWAYSANRIGEVADTIVEIDAAMKTGFNWELGPFEMWDAAGVCRDGCEDARGWAGDSGGGGEAAGGGWDVVVSRGGDGVFRCCVGRVRAGAI